MTIMQMRASNPVVSVAPEAGLSVAAGASMRVLAVCMGRELAIMTSSPYMGLTGGW